MPFGGMKRSGIGRESGFDSEEFFTEPQCVAIMHWKSLFVLSILNQTLHHLQFFNIIFFQWKRITKWGSVPFDILSSCLTLVGFGYYNPPPAILQYSILLKNMSSGESFIPVLVNLFILSFCVVFESLSPTTCNSSTLFSSGKKNRPVVMND